MRGRLLLDGPRPGAWNMALDEALLLAAREDLATLRVYAWSQPTLSIGLFQPRALVPAGLSARCPVVRRPSGGGAILHDRGELTLSLIGRSRGRPPRPDEAAGLVLRGVESLLRPLGALPRLLAESTPGPRGGRPGADLFCGALPSPLDIVADHPSGTRKVLGTAQRRRGRSWLIHGGLRLSRPLPAGLDDDPRWAPAPLEDVLPGGSVPAPLRGENAAGELARILGGAIGEALGLLFEPLRLEPEELLLANRLLAGRYASPAWAGRR